MKTFLLTLLLACWSTMGAFAQATSNLVVFSEQGEKFWLIVNGTKQNAQPLTNVQVLGLKPAGYKLKAIFEDQSAGSVDEFVALDLYPNQEMTVGLKQVDKKKKVKDNKGKTVTKTVKVWKMEVVSVHPINGAAPINHAATQPDYSKPEQYDTTPKADPVKPATPNSQSAAAAPGQLTITMPSVTTDANGNVTMNMGTMNIPEMAAGTYESEPRPRNPQQSAPAQQLHTEPRPDAHPTGCRTPMNDTDFTNARSSVQKQSFEDAKLKVMRQIIAGNCVSTEQVRSMMQLLTYENSKLDFAKQAITRTVDQTAAQVRTLMKEFTYEDSKLQFAKHAYATTRDKSNYYQVNDAFTYSASVDDLNDYIAQQPR